MCVRTKVDVIGEYQRVFPITLYDVYQEENHTVNVSEEQLVELLTLLLNLEDEDERFRKKVRDFL